MFQLNMYERSMMSQFGSGCFSLLLVVLLVVGGLVCANGQAQKEPPENIGAYQAPLLMPSYEEKDTVIVYEDGVYAEKWYINRQRIDAGYLDAQEKQAEAQTAEAERQRERRADMRKRLDERGGKKPPDGETDKETKRKATAPTSTPTTTTKRGKKQ